MRITDSRTSFVIALFVHSALFLYLLDFGGAREAVELFVVLENSSASLIITDKLISTSVFEYGRTGMTVAVVTGQLGMCFDVVMTTRAWVIRAVSFASPT